MSTVHREPAADTIIEGKVNLMESLEIAPVPDTDVFVDLPRVDEGPASPPVPEIPSPTDRDRQDAEHQAFLEVLRERQAQEAYFKELEDFIH